MPAGLRFVYWLDKTFGGWADRIQEWTGKVITRGVEKIVDRFEPEGVEAGKAFITRLRNMPGVPQELKDDIDKMINPSGLWGLVAAIVLVPLMLIPMVFAVFQPLARLLNYAQERIFRSGRMDPGTVIHAFWRGHMTEERMRSTLVDHGLDETDIETLINVTKFYPAPADLVHWQAREVFEPAMRTKYGLGAELGEIEREPFYKAGMTDEQIDNYWMAHWEHASWVQVVEMVRRGQMTEDDVRDWFRLVEIPPYWRDKLIAVSWEVPTRVDVRRFWDMRTIDEARLREIYTAQGYHGKDLEDYVLWTKIYVDFPDLMTRYKNGWLSLDDVRSELVALGMTAERAEELIQTKVKAVASELLAGERAITRTDIIKGVKQGVITRVEGIGLLQDMGYGPYDAEYILEINIPLDDEELIVKQRELSKTDIKAAVKDRILTPAQAIDRLVDLRYSRADAEFLVDIYERLIPVEEVEEERSLTKGDIAAALRKGILSAAETRGMLTGLGYSPEDADILVETNMPPAEEIEAELQRQLAKSDIKSAFNVGLIAAPETLARLQAIGYSPEDAAFLVNIFVAIAALKAVTKPKEAAKADIILAVKKGLLTQQDGYLMLLDLDFTPEASAFIIDVRTEESPFSPRSLAEFQDRSAKYRRVTGMEEKGMPDELIEAAARVVKLTQEVKDLSQSVTAEERLMVKAEGIPETARAKLTDLQVTRNRAVSELARVQAEYDRLVAEWKHKG